MRRPHQQKLADSPLLYTPMIIIPSSIPFGYLINDHYHGAMSMVGMSHQQAMNNEGVIRKHWKTMYRRVLIYEGWRLYGNNPIWWKNLIDNHAAVKRISQQQAMDETVEMMRSYLTTGMRRKKEVQVVVEPECVFVRSLLGLHPCSFPHATHTLIFRRWASYVSFFYYYFQAIIIISTSEHQAAAGSKMPSCCFAWR